MSKKPPTPKIPDTEEAWLSGELGTDEEFVAVAPDDAESIINEQLDLQPISIRLEKSLIEDFKLIAAMHGLGYQPLMRQSLKRFADCEKKRILREAAADMAARKKTEKGSQSEAALSEEPQKKAA
ncbi:MAG: hypothetical protein KJ795_06390 [Gammaproteobacteria bacterium]|nr:hypothetical protein [Gammaproteobacteria bacterium]MBU1777534.1 hypothetical protein [Gammaproteobacteria bacterium]MBU1969610.1 hypothetical protein [Gammaproteobacteria bacterium]